MGLLDSFEKGLERAVNSAFAKTFRSGIQPVEIASALRRELDTKAAVVSRDRILAPNSLTVRLSPADDEKMSSLGATLVEELDTLVQKHAKAQGYSFAGPVSITIRRDDSVPTGTIGVDSGTAAGQVSWRAVVDIDGKRHPLTKSRTVIGRGSDADITIADPGTSRKHVEILWDGRRAMVRDLGSTNGSFLDGRKVDEAALTPESTVRIGRTEIVFRVVAQSTPPRPPMPPADATRAYDVRDGGLAP
ncbi:FhaA domain-containing protein [Micromonospora sp. DT81.3]|uniref:FhaA domain-containing protein n=1 Tax=Actinomycetes TaxID=1760 RepID=UPI003CEB4EBC